MTYRDSGVNLEEAEQSIKAIGSLAKETFNEHVLRGIGLFAGFFELDLKKYSNPVIVSSIDGVGTKLKIAFMTGCHGSVGQDLVNHCVNDIMTCGADPLFFLDYVGTLKLETGVMTEIIRGMAKACKQNGVALIGGETAEMPGFYATGEYDLVGTIIGAVDKERIIDGQNIIPGDVLLGLPSNGLHTNGYSLARKILFDMAGIDVNEPIRDCESTWGECLLKVHKSYQKAITAVRTTEAVVGISHITGGGIEGNTKRLLRDGLGLRIDWSSWKIPPEFKKIQQHGNVSDEEMRRVFNLGIGLILVVSAGHEQSVAQKLKSVNESCFPIGRIIKL
ncbi:phosphoribosylformylglycinamidine cyclo-ligase [candidate division KSB1 bacterium]|nr:phosphoribosylformylglycinamidine cyclo-ligase [candidate division KSB1 bacterium]